MIKITGTHTREPSTGGANPQSRWENALEIDASYEAKTEGESVYGTSERTRKGEFQVVTRKLESPPAPNADKPMKGGDVEILESLLWVLGMSPSQNPGTSGVRLAENQRDTFTAGVPSVGRMMGRFNYISHTPVDTITEQMHTGVVGGANTLEELRRHWVHYFQAYEQWGKRNTLLLTALTDGQVNAAEAVFDGTVAYPAGRSFADITPTYTPTVHDQVTRYGAFKRSDILKAMAQQESSGRQWENLRTIVSGYFDDDVRDETGSKGFNQIKNRYTYGGLAGRCSEIQAYQGDDSLVNHYEGAQNLMAKAIWLAKPVRQCGGSFYSAFVGTSYQGSYTNNDTILRQVKTGSVTDAVANGEHADDAYELLTKGLGGYNRGESIYRNRGSWVGLLTGESTVNASRKIAMEYGMSLMHDADKLNLPYRSYIWEGGNGVDTNGDGAIADIADDPDTPEDETVVETIVPWCFEFGERDWLNPENHPQTGKPLDWLGYRDLAVINIDRRTSCN